MTVGIKFIAVRKDRVLIPHGAYSVQQLELIPQDKHVSIELRQPRNPDHLNKYWAILSKAAENDPELTSADDLHEWIKIRLRMVKGYKDWNGQIVAVTKSISVESMDQIKFNNFYDRALDLLADRLGVDPVSLLDAIY